MHAYLAGLLAGWLAGLWAPLVYLFGAYARFPNTPRRHG